MRTTATTPPPPGPTLEVVVGDITLERVDAIVNAANRMRPRVVVRWAQNADSLLMSGLILYETSNIIHGGETNYVMATVTLFVSIFNLFTSLLHLLGFANSSD